MRGETYIFQYSSTHSIGLGLPKILIFKIKRNVRGDSMPALAYFAFQGFVDERMERLISSLDRNGWHVDVFFIYPRRGWFSQIGGGRHYPIRHKFVTNPILNELFIVPVFLFARFFGEIAKLRGRVRLLYVHNFPDSYALPLLFLAKLYGIPSVYEIRDPWKHFIYAETKDYVRIRKRFIVYMKIVDLIVSVAASFATGFVFVTTSLQESFSKHTKGKPMCLVQNFSDYESSERSIARAYQIRRDLGLEGDFVISYIGGGFQPYRGVDILLESMQLVSSKQPRVKLMIVGGHGETLSQMRYMVRDLEIAKNCVLTGWVPGEELVNYYMASDVGVIPHRCSPATEIAVPNKLFDYLVLGKPVIVTSLAGMSSIIRDGVNGLIVKPDSVEELSNGILRLADNPGLLKSLSAGALRLGEKCKFASLEQAFNAFVFKLSEGS
jgi:glycosyltransferase involved in cell wall biosynthesis